MAFESSVHEWGIPSNLPSYNHIDDWNGLLSERDEEDNDVSSLSSLSSTPGSRVRCSYGPGSVPPRRNVADDWGVIMNFTGCRATPVCNFTDYL